MKLLFPNQNYNILSPSSHTYISERDLYISKINLPILLQEICGPLLGVYKSLTQFPEKEYIYANFIAMQARGKHPWCWWSS